ncbi:hypothetical protein [Streptomyces arenae]|uniref:hypothetical protein n=1 Tax=Streptomyces arenae TaxID=29301 RepID=UPI002658735A|nr:hypothetical protein [Streptomyces arenae]MCG7202615.1 hypothetical protein [Streptomyces arenae]
MTVDQLPGQVREFANYLNGLLARLDHGGGWCAVFWQRDPDGMRACLDGHEVPPWDIVAALLQDLATGYGPEAVVPEAERARPLHADALAAYDARPGARDDLSDRLDVMLREQRYAAERLAQLGRALGSARSREEAESLNLDLAWARDDHERASARCAELRSRLSRLDAGPTAAQWAGGGAAGDAPHGGEPRGGGSRGDDAGASYTENAGVRYAENVGVRYAENMGRRLAGDVGQPSAEGLGEPFAEGLDEPLAGDVGGSPAGDAGGRFTDGAGPGGGDGSGAAVPAPVPAKQRKRRRGSARFAGMSVDEAAPSVVPRTPAPPGPADDRRRPRGARFAGGAEAEARPEPAQAPPDEDAGQAVAGAVELLVRLRAEGRSGEAHALLAEIAQWPAPRLPPLADALRTAGLDADWATLLWEAASLPPARLVTVADALAGAGRTEDARQILRQGVVRPATEIGAAVLALDTAGRHREANALLDTYVQVRTPEEAARCAEPDPRRLVPLLLGSAQAVSDQRHWDLLHALRVAGFAS